MNIIFIILNVILALIGIPMIMKMFENNNVTALNYKKEEIPICLGIIFIFIELITLSIHILIYKDIEIVLYLLGLVVMGMVGLLDDLAGDIEVKGLKGHIKSFFKGELTTGFIKAGVGFFISLIISLYISEEIYNIIINTFIIALSINALNLFDLRPGRCLKVFSLVSLVFIITAKFENYFMLLSIWSIVMVYFKYDIKAKSMMGDTGSNVLGFTLGYYCILTQNIYIRLSYLILLIVLHAIAERVSISKIIDDNKFLRFIDQLGR